MKKVKFTCHNGAFEQGKEYELRDEFAKQLIEDGTAEEVKYDTQPIADFMDESIRKLEEMQAEIEMPKQGVSFQEAVKIINASTEFIEKCIQLQKAKNYGKRFPEGAKEFPRKKATPNQRHAMTVRFAELTEEITEALRSVTKAEGSSSCNLEPWILEALRLELNLKLRQRATLNEWIEKNIFPVD